MSIDHVNPSFDVGGTTLFVFGSQEPPDGVNGVLSKLFAHV